MDGWSWNTCIGEYNMTKTSCFSVVVCQPLVVIFPACQIATLSFSLVVQTQRSTTCTGQIIYSSLQLTIHYIQFATVQVSQLHNTDEHSPFAVNIMHACKRPLSTVVLLLLNFITDSLLHTCAGKCDMCPNYKHYNKDTTLLTT